jgi:hypothetical protein
MALVQAVAGGSVMMKLKVAEQLAKPPKTRRARESLGLRLALVSSLLRDLGAMTSAPDAAAIVLDAEREAGLRALVRDFPPDRLIAAFGLVARAQAALRRNASPKIVADWVAVTI